MTHEIEHNRTQSGRHRQAKALESIKRYLVWAQGRSVSIFSTLRSIKSTMRRHIPSQEMSVRREALMSIVFIEIFNETSISLEGLSRKWPEVQPGFMKDNMTGWIWGK